MFVVSFREVTAEYEILSLRERHAFGGLVLYTRNCRSARQLPTLLAELQAASRHPLLVCTDQEGECVVRVRDGAPI